MTGEFPAQQASNAENASTWWRHHEVWRSCRRQESYPGACIFHVRVLFFYKIWNISSYKFLNRFQNWSIPAWRWWYHAAEGTSKLLYENSRSFAQLLLIFVLLGPIDKSASVYIMVCTPNNKSLSKIMMKHLSKAYIRRKPVVNFDQFWPICFDCSWKSPNFATKMWTIIFTIWYEYLLNHLNRASLEIYGEISLSN